MKNILIGYGQSEGTATEKFRVLGETDDGRYKVEPLCVVSRPDGTQYIARTRSRPLIVRKESLVDIHEEKIKGEENSDNTNSVSTTR